MGDEKDRKSFWASIPGTLTALAALITAIGGIWYSIPDPEISFEATPSRITIGDSAEISWSTNAETVSIVPGNCGTNGSGTCEVSPNKNTTYTIRAKKWGKEKTQTVKVVVLPKPGKLEAIGNYSPKYPKINDEITFDASESKGLIKSYKWDFDDGGPIFGDKVTHQYSKSGTYNVKLTVSNKESEDSIDILVNIVEPPKASWTFSPPNPKIYQEITFDASESKGTRYKWDFGDGDESSKRSPKHDFSEGGTYDVNLTVWNDQGHSDSYIEKVSINLYLKTDEFLKSGEYLVSRNGKYYAIMQENGYLGIYRGTGPKDRLNYNNGQAKWYWPQFLPPNPPYYATVQGDGNFCVYPGADPVNRKGERLWCSEKSDQNKRDYYAIVKDDGSLCVYKGSDPEDQDAEEWMCLSPILDPES